MFAEEEQPLYFENFDLTNVVSPVNAEALKSLLEESHYPCDKINKLYKGFKEGFNIGYKGDKNVQLESRNLILTIGTKTQLWNKVMKEVQAGRYAGPFKKIPFKNYIQSPIGLVPKDNGASTRLIFHLSYPRLSPEEKQRSVNANTPKEDCRVQYADFSEAIKRCLEEGPGCAAGKSDMKSAFRHLGIRPEDWKFLVMKCESPFDGKTYYFVDKCLPFGAAISCKHFQDFSDAVAHIFAFKAGKRAVNYLDDFFFAGLMKLICNGQIKLFLEICKAINFPVSMEKTYWATTSLVFLGILIDTVKQMIFIPQEKFQKASTMINTILNRKKKKVSLGEIQQLCGLLNFFGRCIVPGRAFTRRLYSIGQGLTKKHHHTSLTKENCNDLKVWRTFLEHPLAFSRPFADFDVSFKAQEIMMYTDASRNCRLGCGGFSKTSWFMIQWNRSFILENNPSITYLELYAVTVAVVNWIHRYQNKRIILFCDNLAAVHMINNSSSACKNCMVLIRIITLNGLLHNVRINAQHVKGKANTISDHLSRLRIDSFRKLTGNQFEEKPTAIPHHLWPMSKIWLK